VSYSHENICRILVFQSFAEYEQEPPDVGELREELAA
jgi:hypothetical protein